MNMKAKQSKVPEGKVIRYTRDEMRTKLLGCAPKPMIQTVTLFGMELDIHQPTLGAILAAQSIEDAQERAVDMIVNYAYVPGTDEKVFEMTDRDVILGWPFSNEIVDLQMAIARMTGIDISAAEDVLKQDPLEEQS